MTTATDPAGAVTVMVQSTLGRGTSLGTPGSVATTAPVAFTLPDVAPGPHRKDPGAGNGRVGEAPRKVGTAMMPFEAR